jgi:hypothetical protein
VIAESTVSLNSANGARPNVHVDGHAAGDLDLPPVT